MPTVSFSDKVMCFGVAGFVVEFWLLPVEFKIPVVPVGEHSPLK